MTTRVHEQSILTFDGKDDYINCGNTALGGALAVGNTTLTILGWVNPHRLNPQASGHGTSNVFFARASKKDNDVLELGISPEGNLEVYIDENKDDITKTFGKGELKSQKWHFFTLVFNKGKITAYLDDKKYTGSFKGTSLDESGGSFVTIGCTLHDDIYFCGQIANISVWQRCCSAAEIKKYRYQPLIGNESGLKAYWLINEGTGRTAQDNSANNFKGSIRGATWSVGEVPFNLPPEELGIIAEQLGATNEQLAGVSDQPAESAEQLSGVSQQLGGISQQIGSIPTQPVVSGSQLSGLVQQLSTSAEQLLARASQPSAIAEQLQSISDQLSANGAESSATTEGLGAIANQLSEISEQLAVNAAQLSEISEQSSPILNQEQQTRPMATESQSTDGKPSKKYRILSIDGGGIRGIIPAMILAEIEKRTQKPIHSLFDLIAGTSTGGLISLGLTKPAPGSGPNSENPKAQYTAEDLINMYVEYGGVIFYEAWYEQMLGPLEDLLNRPKFASEGREEVVMKYFGDNPLEDCLKEVLITSYDIEQRIPIFFSSNVEKQWTRSRKFRTLCQGFTLKDAAMATSAAPTYFEPYHVPTSHNTNGYYTLVDGGMVANNPANLAMIEAEMSARKKGETLSNSDILLVSLGTGSLTTAYNYHEAKNWGLVQWARPLMNILFDGGSELVAGELRRLLEPVNREDTQLYYRFQTFLTAELEAMDNATGENIQALQGIAKRLIIEETEEIDRLCDLLTNEAI